MEGVNRLSPPEPVANAATLLAGRPAWRQAVARSGVAVIVCTLALTALGCGSGDDASTSTPRTPAAATTDPAAAAAPDLRGVAIDVRRDPG